MNEHDTVVPSSRRVVGLLFPVEVASPGRGVVSRPKFGRDIVVAARVVPQY